MMAEKLNTAAAANGGSHGDHVTDTNGLLPIQEREENTYDSLLAATKVEEGHYDILPPRYVISINTLALKCLDLLTQHT